MPSFKDNLETFPDAQGIARLDLVDAQGRVAGTVENRPGSQGSLRLYLELARRFGALTQDAARAGCALYAEHHEDAKLNPGKHPNVDRLLAVAQGDVVLAIRIVRG